MPVGFDFSAGSLPAGVTLTRAGSAKRINSSGVLVTETTNVARFDYTTAGVLRGLMVEAAGTNLAPASQAFDNTTYWASANSGTTAPSVSPGYPAPDGTSTGYQIAFGGSSGGAYSVLYTATTIALTAGYNAVSIWGRAVSGGTTTYIALTMGSDVYFLTLALTGAYQRFTAVFNVATSGNYSIVIGPDSRDTNRAAASTVNCHLWGVQVEQAPAATSYITNPTTAGGTRAADNAVLDWSSLGVGNGTITARYTFDDASTQDVVTVISGGTSTVPTNLNRRLLMGVIGVGLTIPDTFNNPAIFPLLPGQLFPALKTPLWNSKIVTAASGRERRRKQWSYPRWRFKIGHEVLRDTIGYPEVQRLTAFFNAHGAQFAEFSYFDANDNSVTDQAFGTGDGTTTTFQLLRTGGAGSILFTEPVRSIVSCKVKVNGTPTTVTINSGGTVTFATAPAAGAVLTWTGIYMFLVRFEQDDMDASQLMQGLWSQSGLALITVKK